VSQFTQTILRNYEVEKKLLLYGET